MTDMQKDLMRKCHAIGEGRCNFKRSGFTLIELLVVVAIIAIFQAMLSPGLTLIFGQ